MKKRCAPSSSLKRWHTTHLVSSSKPLLLRFIRSGWILRQNIHKKCFILFAHWVFRIFFHNDSYWTINSLEDESLAWHPWVEAWRCVLLTYNHLAYVNYFAYFDYIKCLQRRLNSKKKASRAQDHTKEQAAKDRVTEIWARLQKTGQRQSHLQTIFI